MGSPDGGARDPPGRRALSEALAGPVALWLPARPAQGRTVTRAMHDDDAALLYRVRDGDERAFEQLVARYERRLQRYLRAFVRDEEKARELVQDTFVKV